MTAQDHRTSRWWKILVPICFCCLNCTKFGQLLFRKMIKIFVTRCQILRLKCTKFDVGWGWRGWEGRGKEGRGKEGLCSSKNSLKYALSKYVRSYIRSDWSDVSHSAKPRVTPICLRFKCAHTYTKRCRADTGFTKLGIHQNQLWSETETLKGQE